MSKYIPGNHKHLTAEDRLFIENGLKWLMNWQKPVEKHCCRLRFKSGSTE